MRGPLVPGLDPGINPRISLPKALKEMAVKLMLVEGKGGWA